MITKEELYARLNEERDDVNQDITVPSINYPFNFNRYSMQVGLMLLYISIFWWQYIPEVKDPMATAVDIGEHSVSTHS